jgi:hypothetical protein
VNIEQQWNDADRKKPKDVEKYLSQFHFVHHESHMDWPGREPGPPVANRLSYGTAVLFSYSLYGRMLIRSYLLV